VCTCQVRAVAARRHDTVCVSGRSGEGVPDLLALLSHKLAANMTQVGGCKQGTDQVTLSGVSSAYGAVGGGGSWQQIMVS
jgi:hypothetical protein